MSKSGNKVKTEAENVIYIELDIRPQSKKRPRFDGKKAYHCDRYTQWLNDAAFLIQEKYHGVILTHVSKFTCHFYGGKGDLDNMVGGIMDALTRAQVWEDDSVVKWLECRHIPARKQRIQFWIEV